MRLMQNMVAGVCAALLAASPAWALNSTGPRRVLVAQLYPYIPQSRAAYFEIEKAFETRHPDIDLRVELNEDSYYDDRPGKGGILETKADVYELDSVFLADAVKAGKIQALPGNWAAVDADLVPMSVTSARLDGLRYGLPHWLCGNFLFYRRGDTALARAKTLADVQKALDEPFPGQWLLADLSGKSTLGEMYLDGLMDRYKTADQALSRINPQKLDGEVVAAMERVIGHLRPGFGRDGDYHDRAGFYGRRFGHGEGRAMVSYSEQLHYVLDEGLNDCRKDESCIRNSAELGVVEWPLSDLGSSPIAWVDLLVVDASLSGDKLRDAEQFLRFMAEPATYKLFLVPAWGQAPRYLLPAQQSLFSDPEITKAAPLYPDLLSIISRAIPLTAPRLNGNLREIGKTLDGQLRKN